MKSLIVCIAVFFSISLKSQLGNEKDWKIIGIIMCTRLEATSIDNKTFLSFGPKIPISENNYVSLRGHFNWWDVPGRKFIVIPELDYFRKIGSFSDDSITNLYLGAGITPNAVSPKVGLISSIFFQLNSVTISNTKHINILLPKVLDFQSESISCFNF